MKTKNVKENGGTRRGSSCCLFCSQPVTTGKSSGRQTVKDTTKVFSLVLLSNSNPLLRAQLEAFYLAQSLLKLPSDVCQGLFSSYGNPGEWIRLCPSCQARVGDALDLHLKIKDLVSRIEDIRTRLLHPLLVSEEDKVQIVDPSSECQRQIRSFLLAQNLGTSRTTKGVEDKDNNGNNTLVERCSSSEDDMPALTRRRRRRQEEEEEDEICDRNNEEEDEIVMIDVDCESEEEEEEVKVMGVVVAEENNVMKEEQGSALLNRLFDGMFYTCPIPPCGGQSWTVKEKFMAHVSQAHAHFLDHLREKKLPSRHKCKEGVCIPSTPIFPSLLSKEEILKTLTPMQLMAKLTTKQDHFLCPFCPLVKYPKRGVWEDHMQAKHPKFLLHLKEEDHECEEGNCLPRTKGFPVSDWPRILQMKEEHYSRPIVKRGEKRPRYDLREMWRRYRITTFPCTKSKCPMSPFSSYDDWLAHRDQRSCDQEDEDEEDDVDTILLIQKRKSQHVGKTVSSSSIGKDKDETAPGNNNKNHSRIGVEAPCNVSQEDVDKGALTLTRSSRDEEAVVVMDVDMDDPCLDFDDGENQKKNRLPPISAPRNNDDDDDQVHDPEAEEGEQAEGCIVDGGDNGSDTDEDWQMEDVEVTVTVTKKGRYNTRASSLGSATKKKRDSNSRSSSDDSREDEEDEDTDDEEETLDENLPDSVEDREKILTLTGSRLLAKIFDGVLYTCPLPTCEGQKAYQMKGTFMTHVTNYHAPFLDHLNCKKKLPSSHKCVEGVCIPSLLLQDLPSLRKSKLNPADPIYPSLLSKEEIQSLSPGQIMERLTTEKHYLCPFCPLVKYPLDKKKSWLEHIRERHFKFRLHLNVKGVPPHECEEGSCLPRSTGTLVPDWPKILQMKEEHMQNRIKGEKGKFDLKELALKYRIASFPCIKCPKDTVPFSTWKKWRAHTEAVHKPGYPCHVCSLPYFPLHRLEAHVRANHTQEEFLTCSGCQESFMEVKKFNAHLEKEAECLKKALPCSTCSLKCESTGSLEVHMSTRHDDRKQPPFRCGDCGKTFWRNESYKAHMELHTGEGYICPSCGIWFGNKLQVQKHIKLKHSVNRKVHVCSICSKEFNYSQSLRKHLELHRPGLHYLCPVCGKGFKTHHYLSIHSLSHDPEGRKRLQVYHARMVAKRKAKGLKSREGRGPKYRVKVVEVPSESQGCQQY